jgi:Ca2+-binding EF-hand superfamily protein
MRNLLLGFNAAVLIGLAGYVMAQTGSAPEDRADRDTQLRLSRLDTSDAAFRKLDHDGDGRISALEAADNPKVAAAFTMADRDKDGYLSKEEFQAMGTAGRHSSDVDASR